MLSIPNTCSTLETYQTAPEYQSGQENHRDHLRSVEEHIPGKSFRRWPAFTEIDPDSWQNQDPRREDQPDSMEEQNCRIMLFMLRNKPIPSKDPMNLSLDTFRVGKVTNTLNLEKFEEAVTRRRCTPYKVENFGNRRLLEELHHYSEGIGN